MKLLHLLLLVVVLAGAAMAQQKLKAGAVAPDFVGQAMDGSTVSLSQLQGKVVVLTFWSTRCEICHNEIPKLNQVAARYKDKDVVFLALTTENQTRIEPYLKKNPFNFSILPNSFGVVLKYADMDGGGNINIGFPAHFVINKSGSIQMRTDGWAKSSVIESQISQMLATE